MLFRRDKCRRDGLFERTSDFALSRWSYKNVVKTSGKKKNYAIFNPRLLSTLHKGDPPTNPSRTLRRRHPTSASASINLFSIASDRPVSDWATEVQSIDVEIIIETLLLCAVVHRTLSSNDRCSHAQS